MDIMEMAKHTGATTVLADMFDQQASDFLRLHTLAYGTEHLRPKHHYMFHVGRQWREDKFVLDCFVHERKHQAIKACANHIKNTRALERGVLAAAVNASIHQMEKAGLRQCIVGDK